MEKFRDHITTMLKATNRNPKLWGQFGAFLARSRVFLLVAPDNRAKAILDRNEGKPFSYFPCFSSQKLAQWSWERLSALNPGAAVKIKAENVLKLFVGAAVARRAIYLNPLSAPDERHLFSIGEVKRFLASPWALDLFPAAGGKAAPRQLKRSRQGRNTVRDQLTDLPFDDVYSNPAFTTAQIAGMYQISENEINRRIASLADEGLVDLSLVSVPIDGDPPGRSIVLYEPEVAFWVGFRLEGKRGDEFRAWLFGLLTRYLNDSKIRPSDTPASQGMPETFAQEKDALETEIQERELVIDNLNDVINRLSSELAETNKMVAELHNDLQAAGSWDLPRSVMEAKTIAEARYSSRVVFHDQVNRAIEKYRLNNNLTAAYAAARILKALAECLHPMVFERGEFSEERFRAETGLALSMTESRASKRDKAIEETRKFIYDGREVTCYPHVKEDIQGMPLRLHFALLSEASKILVCHIGEHLPNAMTKFI